MGNRKYTGRHEEPGASVDRIARVNELLKREIADFLQSRRFDENGILVSVTKVECASSLKEAGVSISIFGADDEAKAAVFRRLNRMRGEIQASVSKHVILKYTPVLHFIDDLNIAEGDRVLALIRQMEHDESK